MGNKKESIDLFQLGLMLSKREGVKDLGNNTFAAKTQDEIVQEIIEENAKIKKQDILDLRKVLDNLDAPNEEIEKTVRICTELKNKLKRERHLNPDIDIRIMKDLDNYLELLDLIIIECIDRLKHRTERNKKITPPKKAKVVYTKFDDAVKDPNALNEICKILIEQKAIDEKYIFQGTATDLYSYIKRLKKLLFFKEITAIDLHLLVNEKFICTAGYSTFRDAPEAKLNETEPYKT